MTTHEAPSTVASHPFALSYKEAAAYVGLCKRTLMKLVATGEFPKPRQVRGTTALRFKRSEVEEWFDRQPEHEG